MGSATMTYEPELMAQLRSILEDVSRVNDDWFKTGAFKTWKNPTPVKYEVADAAGTVDTLEGPMKHAAGHYIMTGPKGERYPIAPEKFASLYDDNGNGTATPKRVEKWAKVADHDGVLHTSWGDLAYTTCNDYIVRHGPNDYGAVKADIFAKTYHQPGGPQDTLAEGHSNGTWTIAEDVLNGDDFDADEIQSYLDAVYDGDFDAALDLLNEYLAQGENNGAWWGSMRALELKDNPIDPYDPFILFNRDPHPTMSKDSVIKAILLDIKNSNMDRAVKRYTVQRMNGVDWPELDAIERSLRAEGQINEAKTDLNIVDEKRQLAAVKRDGWRIQEIQAPSPAVQLAAVQQEGQAICYIKDTSPEVQLAAVQQNARALQHIRKPSPKVQMAAVREWSYAIQYIPKPSPEVQMAAVRRHGYAIEYISDPSPEVQMAAVQQVSWAIEYIKDPSPEVQLAAVQENGRAIQFIEDPSPAVQLAAVQEFGGAIRHIKTPSPALWADGEAKTSVMRALLTSIRDGDGSAQYLYQNLRRNNCPWPELDIIGKSSEASKALSESAVVAEAAGISQDELLDAMRKFLIIAKEEIGLDQLPKIHWSWDDKIAQDSPSFGRFTNDDKAIKIIMRNRHPIDIMRTLAHELVHYKQDVEHRIDSTSGETGSPIENEANALAGQIMRRFDEENPELFALAAVIP